MLIEQLLEGDAEALIRRMIDQAKAGNSRALSLLVPALLPKRKDAVIEIDLPSLEQASDAPRAIATIIAAVCAGEISPQEGMSLTRMVEAYVRAKQKIGECKPRTKREKAADVAVAKTPEPAGAHASPGREATSPAPAIVQADAATQLGEPRVDSPAPEDPRPVLARPPARSLPRLREDILSTTSPLAHSATRPAAIVSHCYPRTVRPAAPGRIPAAA